MKIALLLALLTFCAALLVIYKIVKLNNCNNNHIKILSLTFKFFKVLSLEFHMETQEESSAHLKKDDSFKDTH